MSEDVGVLKVQKKTGVMDPDGTGAMFRVQAKPYRVPRYNLFPAAEVMGAAAPSVASGTALKRMEELAEQVLPKGIGYEWTDLAHQQEQAGIPTVVIFGASALFVFLVLTAQYESWTIPLAIVLIVPMCLLAAATGLNIPSIPTAILPHIRFLVL